ncbi:MAG: hypothetical protein AAGF12_43630, partial [Myxococcota bacterium]
DVRRRLEELAAVAQPAAPERGRVRKLREALLRIGPSDRATLLAETSLSEYQLTMAIEALRENRALIAEGRTYRLVPEPAE